MIEFVDIHKSLGGQPVLQGLSFRIERGETFGIMGRSGCGKSVTLKHLVGLMKPDQGQVLVDGMEVSQSSGEDLEQVRQKFGFLFQSGALLNSLSVGDNIALPLREQGQVSETEIGQRVDEVLARVELRHLEKVMPAELSGGMRKRVALARAIVTQPEIILYDEPTTGLDPIMANAINDLISHMHKALKVTSIVVTHDMNCLFRVASRIILLYQGKVIRTGSPQDFRTSSDPYIRQFVEGAPEGPFKDEDEVKLQEKLSEPESEKD